MLEAQVHRELRNFLRQTQQSQWVHHLTMARMVARGLRLGRSAIIQTGTNQLQYYLSYLIPALLSEQSVIIVTSAELQQQLIEQQIPQLQQWLKSCKTITTKLVQTQKYSDNIVVTTFQVWLEDRFNSGYGRDIPTIIDNCENLPESIRDYLTIRLTSQDLSQLQLENIENQDLIRENLAQLTRSIFAHPPNPYNSYLFDDEETIIIQQLTSIIANKNNYLAKKLELFSQQLSSAGQYFNYVKVDRQQGTFVIQSSPLTLREKVGYLWKKQPLILIANYLAPEKEVKDYSNLLEIDINNFTCLKFSSHSQNTNLNLYLPNNLPLPNHPKFQIKVKQEILALVGAVKINHSPIIVLVEDFPLQTQITASLAAQFGSRVKLNSLRLSQNGILVCDSKYWLKHQSHFDTPQLLIMTTLPIPSLENPLIAAQVTYYKNQKKDWFRLFLLPLAIQIIQRGTLSIRQNQGVVAVLDNRVNLRSYGQTILQVLEPYAKVDYLDLNWLNLA